MKPIGSNTVKCVCMVAVVAGIACCIWSNWKNGLDDRKNAGKLVNHVVDKEALSYSSPVPFQLPEGEKTGSGSGHPNGASSEDTAASERVPANLKWKKSEHPLPVPTPEESAADALVIKQSNMYIAQGNNTAAISLCANALRKMPGDVQLRMATVKAYIAGKRYRDARLLCKAGMDDASNESDFLVLYDLLKTIP